MWLEHTLKQSPSWWLGFVRLPKASDEEPAQKEELGDARATWGLAHHMSCTLQHTQKVLMLTGPSNMRDCSSAISRFRKASTTGDTLPARPPSCVNAENSNTMCSVVVQCNSCRSQSDHPDQARGCACQGACRLTRRTVGQQQGQCDAPGCCCVPPRPSAGQHGLCLMA